MPVTTRKIVSTVTLCAIQSLLSPALAAARNCEPVAKLISISGHVEHHNAESTLWQSTALPHSFCEDDQLRTDANSQAAVRMVNETLVQLDSHTTLNFTRIKAREHSILDLIKGVIHSISRVPRSLDIKTPYVNAVIEGTEFVVTVTDDSTQVAVLEGIVLTQNDQGSVRVHSGETGYAKAGEAPSQETMIHPRDTVAWSLDYPPVLSRQTLDKRGPLDDRATAALDAWMHGNALGALGILDQSAEQNSVLDPDLTLDQNNQPAHLLIRAAALLRLGQVAAAETLLQKLPKDPVAESMLAIVDIANNRLNQAESRIDHALTTAPQLDAAWVAKSYLQQARFDIPGATASVQQAYTLSPDSGLILARLATIHLMNGDLHQAEEFAGRSLAKAPHFEHAYLVQGFSQLQGSKPKAAEVSFERALKEYSPSAYAHFGLGLSLIRQGHFHQGREELETATLLDPGKATLRSYMGKAYFEEQRNKLAYKQLFLAKKLDPNDPTAWFYESVLLYRDNRPIEALQSMEGSIARNNNRGVYRSRLLLDDDKATRNAALGTLYQSLGFENLATHPASLSLTFDPTNAAAHHLLADSYAGQYRHDVSRVNELLLAQLNSDTTHPMIQPQLLRSRAALLDHGGPRSPGYNEFNPLFVETGGYGTLNATVAGQQTLGNDLVLGYIDDNYALNAAHYHFSTNGFFDNQDYREDTTRLQLQWQATEKTKLQLDTTRNEVDKGSVALRFNPEANNPSYRNNSIEDSYAIGLTNRLTGSSQLTAYTSYSQEDDTQSGFAPNVQPYISGFDGDLDGDTRMYHLQYAQRTSATRWLIGSQYANAKTKSKLLVDFLATPSNPDITREESTDYSDTRAYAYLYKTSENTANNTVNTGMKSTGLSLTAGIEVAKQNTEQAPERTHWLPKLGLTWTSSPRTTLGLAAFKSLNSAITPASFTTLAPTQIAGFDQLFSGARSTTSNNLGLSLEYAWRDNLKTGFRARQQRATTPQRLLFINPSPTIRPVDIRSQFDDGVAWLYWTPNDRFSVSLEHHVEKYSDDFEEVAGSSPDGIESLTTRRTPLKLGYHHASGFSATVDTSYISQKGVFWLPAATSGTAQKGSFWLTNVALSYPIPSHRGTLSVGVKNAFDRRYHYEDLGSYASEDTQGSAVPSRFAAERLWYATLSLAF
ncbi:MAG: FecR domain-containing protein [bacterium]